MRWGGRVRPSEKGPRPGRGRYQEGARRWSSAGVSEAESDRESGGRQAKRGPHLGPLQDAEDNPWPPGWEGSQAEGRGMLGCPSIGAWVQEGSFQNKPGPCPRVTWAGALPLAGGASPVSLSGVCTQSDADFPSEFAFRTCGVSPHFPGDLENVVGSHSNRLLSLRFRSDPADITSTTCGGQY